MAVCAVISTPPPASLCSSISSSRRIRFSCTSMCLWNSLSTRSAMSPSRYIAASRGGRWAFGITGYSGSRNVTSCNAWSWWSLDHRLSLTLHRFRILLTGRFRVIVRSIWTMIIVPSSRRPGLRHVARLCFVLRVIMLFFMLEIACHYAFFYAYFYAFMLKLCFCAFMLGVCHYAFFYAFMLAR